MVRIRFQQQYNQYGNIFPFLTRCPAGVKESPRKNLYRGGTEIAEIASRVKARPRPDRGTPRTQRRPPAATKRGARTKTQRRTEERLPRLPRIRRTCSLLVWHWWLRERTNSFRCRDLRSIRDLRKRTGFEQVVVLKRGVLIQPQGTQGHAEAANLLNFLDLF